MELVSFAKDVIQNVAEQVASYRLGQTALRHIDRALWVVEKCARWAVPPPLDADERPQPELVRPLPWIFFLTMLVTLRITRESISLINLILGKPPLRSADVVMYIQSKRRYLRTLKYQGNRSLRARRAPSGEPWYSGLKAMFEFTMCFRRSHNYGNNNTTRVSNNDEVLVVKRSKRTRDPGQGSGSNPGGETPMERLIEKMMVDLDADSDDDSSYTLTNATSLRSLRSEESELDQDNTLENHNTTLDTSVTSDDNDTVGNNAQSPAPMENSNVASSTPERSPEMKNGDHKEEKEAEAERKEIKTENGENENVKKDGKSALEPNHIDTPPHSPEHERDSPNEKKTMRYSPKETSNNFLQGERCSPQKASKQTKFANGRAMSVPNKKKGLVNQRRDSDTPLARVASADDSF